MPITKTMIDTQQALARIAPTNSKGKPAFVDGIPQWSTTNPDVVVVVPASDGMSCLIRAISAGDAQVAVTADADLGAGIVPIAESADVHVTASPVTALNLVVDAPVDQP